MNYSVILTPRFKREAKRLSKKWYSLKQELVELGNQLAVNPQLGKSLGAGAYKVRLSVKSKGKGKSGGARIITYIVTEDAEIYLLTIYDKSELDTINDKIIKGFISELRVD